MLALFTSESSVPGYVMAHSGCSINVAWTVIFEDSASEPQGAFMVGVTLTWGKHSITYRISYPHSCSGWST